MKGIYQNSHPMGARSLLLLYCIACGIGFITAQRHSNHPNLRLAAIPGNHENDSLTKRYNPNEDDLQDQSHRKLPADDKDEDKKDKNLDHKTTKTVSRRKKAKRRKPTKIKKKGTKDTNGYEVKVSEDKKKLTISSLKVEDKDYKFDLGTIVGVRCSYIEKNTLQDSDFIHILYFEGEGKEMEMATTEIEFLDHEVCEDARDEVIDALVATKKCTPGPARGAGLIYESFQGSEVEGEITDKFPIFCHNSCDAVFEKHEIEKDGFQPTEEGAVFWGTDGRRLDSDSEKFNMLNAQAFAIKNKMETLEQTVSGEKLVKKNLFAPGGKLMEAGYVWNCGSMAYAAYAGNFAIQIKDYKIHVFSQDVSATSIYGIIFPVPTWFNIELATLVSIYKEIKLYYRVSQTKTTGEKTTVQKIGDIDFENSKEHPGKTIQFLEGEPGQRVLDIYYRADEAYPMYDALGENQQDECIAQKIRHWYCSEEIEKKKETFMKIFCLEEAEEVMGKGFGKH